MGRLFLLSSFAGGILKDPNQIIEVIWGVRLLLTSCSKLLCNSTATCLRLLSRRDFLQWYSAIQIKVFLVNSSFLNCSLLELYSLSFSLMFEERGLRTFQIFISLPIYIIYQRITDLSTLQNFMTTVSEIQLGGTTRESHILMRILKTSLFFVGFDRHFCA